MRMFQETGGTIMIESSNVNIFFWQFINIMIFNLHQKIFPARKERRGMGRMRFKTGMVRGDGYGRASELDIVPWCSGLAGSVQSGRADLNFLHIGSYLNP